MKKYHEINARQKRFIMIMASATALFLFFYGLAVHPFEEYSIRNLSGTSGYTEETWLLQQPETGVYEKIELPDHFRMESGKRYILSTRLTYDGEKDKIPYGYIHIDHVFCQVSLDDEILFTCMPEEGTAWENLKSPGYVYKAFSLPHDCRGKELKIELLPIMNSVREYDLPDISFGDMTATMYQAVMKDNTLDGVITMCIVLGVTSIVFSGIALPGYRFREVFFVGAFSLAFSMYLITECEINNYFMGNPYRIYVLNYITFSLLPILLMAFMRERLPAKHHRACSWAIAAESAFFAVQIYMHFNGVYDLHEFIPIVQAIYFFNVSLIFGLILAVDDKKKKMSLLIQIIPALLGMVLDASAYWLHLNIGSNDATFTVYGVIFFLLIEILHISKSALSMYGESVRSMTYMKMAYVDELTNVGNRRAFDAEIEKIQSHEQTYWTMVVVSADVNKLKFVNDNFGHAAGDCLIQSAAQIMRDVFGDVGKIFRTGGDEFSIFLYDIDLKRYKELELAMIIEEDRFNEDHPFELSIALGSNQIYDDAVLEAIRKADHRMYEDKVAHKMQRVDEV